MAAIRSLSFDPTILTSPLGPGDKVPGTVAIRSVGNVVASAGTASVME